MCLFETLHATLYTFQYPMMILLIQAYQPLSQLDLNHYRITVELFKRKN
jgi:hypothetical protein